MKRMLLLALSLLKGRVWLAKRLGVSIGDGCRIYIASWGSEPFLISIGNRVTVTSGVRFLTHDGATWLVRDAGVRYQRFAQIRIGDDVFIGVNAIIMPGVEIGSRSIVAAGSVVTKSIEPGSIVAGCPARRIGTFDEFAQKVRATCASDSQLPAGSYRERVRRAIAIQSEKADS